MTRQRMKVALRFLALLMLISLCQIKCDDECSTPGECANPDVEAEGTKETLQEDDPSCPSRPFVIQCAGQYLDVNQNGHLERAELQSAIDALPWYSRGIISILGSVDKMMKKCDVDGDGAISIDYDMKNNGATCLATCFKRVAFKKAFFPECTPESLSK